MGKGIGICCIALGICCLIVSAGFVVFNHWEGKQAQQTSVNLLQEVRQSIFDNTQEESIPEESDRDETIEIPEELPQEMQTTEVNGYECIGILSIPVLELELPVLTDWSYEKLKIAPCHYYGSFYRKDFVIAAHNYPSFFRRLPELQPKDLVLFTDVSGTAYYYEVVLLETLPPEATEEMITSGFDLSLYTCTPGGASRVTVRCNKVSGA